MFEAMEVAYDRCSKKQGLWKYQQMPMISIWRGTPSVQLQDF